MTRAQIVAVADIEPFRRPPGCRLHSCIALADGNAEVTRLHLAEAALSEALRRERGLLIEKEALIKHTELLGREADHRLLNGLQMVSSLLSLQARQADEPGVAAQLREAARRVVAVASVHGSLHSVDQAEDVELKGYLTTLGRRLSGLVSADVE
ncbi:MAG: histidine kinase dimerization/phosphoacceptor domain -containing protein, partial [Hyphomonadaceae bacterium]